MNEWLFRGRDEDAETKSDGVLSAQVLPVVWHQQGEVGRRERIPVQLSTRRPFVRLHASGAGESVAAVAGGHH